LDVNESADLLDINVWLALGLPDHPHHERALKYWNHASTDQIAFCRITALGMVRLLTNSTVMGGEPLSPGDAWTAYRRFAALPEVALIPEPPGLEDRLAAFIGADAVTPRLWTDAYLAAFALSAGLRMVSFDNDFGRFDGLVWYRP
jgi:toxin-antitoxin system PIN domain toxin